MKEKLFILSDYDGGYYCSIMVNGVEYEKDEIRSNEILHRIYKEYDAFDYDTAVELIKEHFDIDLVIICADGTIEIREIN